MSNAFARIPRAWKGGAVALACAGLVTAGLTHASSDAATAIPVPVTTTPIKHVVVLFDENISLDHYFGTYTKAANTDGTKFTAKRGTPRIDGLSAPAGDAQANREDGLAEAR